MIRPLVGNSSSAAVDAQRVRVARSGSIFVGRAAAPRYMFDYGGTATSTTSSSAAKTTTSTDAAAAAAAAIPSTALAAAEATPIATALVAETKDGPAAPTSAEQRTAVTHDGSTTYADLVQLVADLSAAREVGLATERGLREEIARLRACRGVDAVRGETLALLRANEAMRNAIAARSPLGARLHTESLQAEELQRDAKSAARDAEVLVLRAQLADRTEALDAALAMHENQRVAIEALKLHSATVGDDARGGEALNATVRSPETRLYTERGTPPPSMSPIVRVSRDGSVYIQ